MADRGKLVAELEALDATLTELVQIASRTDPDRKLALVRQRRKLAERIAALNVAATEGKSPFAQGAHAEEFRARFSKMRSAVALHQATWSVVRLDEANDEYHRSAAGSTSTLRDFLTWTRRVLANESHNPAG